MSDDNDRIKYLRLLSKQFPNIPAVATEIVNLKAILSLPKGTEHFITDIHGEYEQFRHIMCSGSGAVKRKIEEEFGSILSVSEKRAMEMLVYYPELKIKQIKESRVSPEEMPDWYRVTILRLVRLCRHASSKYTRSKVRKALPESTAYIIEELMTGRPDEHDQEAYYNKIISTVIETKMADRLIIDLCYLVRRFTIDHLHVIGDIFDRGAYPHKVMDDLMAHHSMDIQWGNHDVLWMGAAAGSEVCIANVLRISARYGHLGILENSYGINLIPLMKLAEVYGDDPCSCFRAKISEDEEDPDVIHTVTMMHKAVSILQFKLEKRVADDHPEWNMQDRELLGMIDYEKGTVMVDGCEYQMKDMNFPTIDPEDPYALTPEEEETIRHLRDSFRGSERLQRHVRFLFTKGSLYKIYNGNLLFHGCVPLNEDGSFTEVEIRGKKYSGKALYDVLEQYMRNGYYSVDPLKKKFGEDIFWYLWQGSSSPVYGKAKMATFERYFIDDKTTHREEKNAYYRLYENEETVDMILKDFGLPANGAHIVNGHVPVAVKKGESPVKCGGKLLVIDGGFSKAYQGTTGIAGYTLIYNSQGLLLAAHEPFESMEKTVLTEKNMHSHIVMEEYVNRRRLVADTDAGKQIAGDTEDLQELLEAYRSGILVEKF